MKNLLVLTDFTANASHAETAALRISGQLGYNIILYHTLPYVPLIPNDNGGPYVAETASILFEDSKERLIQEADKLREVAVIRDCYVNIDEKNGDGTLGDVIADLTDDSDIEMVVMGGRSGGTLDHLLRGSDTAAVIRKSRKPVLIIPMTANLSDISKVVFATDFGTTDIPAVGFLQDLSSRMGLELDIVHVIPPGEVVTEIGPEVAFRKYLAHHKLNYNQVKAADVHQGLQHYCGEKGAALLAMTHGQHSFISRLFGHSESEAVISDQRLAVLIFPPDFK